MDKLWPCARQSESPTEGASGKGRDYGLLNESALAINDRGSAAVTAMATNPCSAWFRVTKVIVKMGVAVADDGSDDTTVVSEEEWTQSGKDGRDVVDRCGLGVSGPRVPFSRHEFDHFVFVAIRWDWEAQVKPLAWSTNNAAVAAALDVLLFDL
jgi:hypothetical protein